MGTYIPQRRENETPAITDRAVPVINGVGPLRVTSEPGSEPGRVELVGDAIDLLLEQLRLTPRLKTTPLDVQWVIGGHPDLQSLEWVFTSSQVNQVMLVAPPLGQRIYVTEAGCFVDGDTTVSVACRVGFSSSGALPTIVNNSLTGLRGSVLSHPDIVSGSGYVTGNGTGVVSISQMGESMLITCDAATAGSLRVVVKLFFAP